ncbi:hypothetical protein DAI22_03g210900 [Oryza sativa Japonica Group]|nr:hypothetical protein DAI22_03g210900 [Oryza sativa Japonica Group]
MSLLRAKQLGGLAMFIPLALLLLCYGVPNVNCSTVDESRLDLQSLLDIKQKITSDPNGMLSSWNKSIHYCRWVGVICTSKRPRRVSSLTMTGQSLTGQISSSLQNLTLLNLLDLSYNSFSGPLPPVNNLQQLQTLYLNNNNLDGTIPDSFTNSSSLAYVDLSSNFLGGEIPRNISLLSKLVGLTLSSNSLTGTIPTTLSEINSLQGLQVAQNKLEGSIPDGVWQLPNIVELMLGQNRLSGRIPQIFPNMPNITSLGLELNMLHGTLPPNMGDALPSLVNLTLNDNKFEGHIPASLGKASMIQTMDLSRNNFAGRIPSSLGKLSELAYVNLQQNNLEARDSESWEFLQALRNCRSLQKLILSSNQLQGVLPDSVGDLSENLQYLLLGGNKLSGIVPSSIGNLQGLTWLGLEINEFTGPIEEWVGKLTNLQSLNLGRNSFIGKIPPSIGKLTNLTKLTLGHNEFSGLIPSSLGNLQHLLYLDLSYNNLEGNISWDFTNLKQLTELYLSSNKLNGGIPDTLGQCQNLVIVQMDKNNLSGNIPDSLGNLKSLSMLNLSYNSLSGTIPRSLNDFKFIAKLDLSHNYLQGEIPRTGILDNASVVSLDGNSGLCGGATYLHLPPCPSGPRKTERRYYLVKILIPIFGFMSLVVLIYFLFLEKKAPRRKYQDLNDFGENFLKVSYKDLAQATRDFSVSNLIGRGSHGSVYRGKLKEQKVEVAVKVFDLEMRGAERSFMSECEALRSIQHRNLLPIITACSTLDNIGNVFKALVYEFMPNGNLDTWLHHKDDSKELKRLSLAQRISIAVNIADVLDYLHHDCGRPTVHCDLKPSNILLDDDMNALLADFGIASFYSDSSSKKGPISSVGVKGTIGYIAPEYAGGGYASTTGDVYSFGVVLLEMMTSKRPTDPMFRDGLDIVTFVQSNVEHQILHVVDPYLNDECKNFAEANMVSENAVHQCLTSLLYVALSCTHSVPSERKNMKEIASRLHAIKTSYLTLKAKKTASL